MTATTMRTMATQTQLAHAPIREALVDLRTAGGTVIGLPDLEPLKEQFSAEYPNAEQQNRMEARFEAHAERTGGPLSPLVRNEVQGRTAMTQASVFEGGQLVDASGDQ